MNSLRTTYVYILGLLGIMWILPGCTSYLEDVAEAALQDEEVFSSYDTFQGFEDKMYDHVINYLNTSITASLNWGEDVICNRTFPPSGAVDGGNYWYFWTNRLQNILLRNADADPGGLWQASWTGIRMANISLERLDEGFPLDATDEQRDLLRGQALFFRAFFHWELIRFYGGMPYIDVAFSPSDDLRRARLSYQETTERIVTDMDLAAELLPEDWAFTSLGARFPNGTKGRATKGAALSVKAKALLYAASPLMNEEAGNGYTFNQSLAERSAEAAWQVIKLADQGIYRLLSWPEYSDNFYRNDVGVMWSDEFIWDALITQKGQGRMSTFHGRVFNNSRWQGNAVMEAPTANYVELFEMANGLPIDDPASGYDPDNPWDNRDPRFDYCLLLDGTQWADAANPVEDNFVQTHLGGVDRGNNGSLTGYMIKKYWPRGVNAYDRDWAEFRFTNPHIRLAEMYLIYAEAVNEYAGPNATPNFNGETGIPAVEAINIVRRRAGQPDVAAKFTGSADLFRPRIWNERAIELAFEGSRWFDIRRWHVAHLPEYKEMYGLEFDKDHTFFRKVLLQTRVFEERHYWIPIDQNQAALFEDFKQNPGW